MKNSKIKICYIASADIALKFILLNHLKFLKNKGYNVFAVCSPGKWVEDIRSHGIQVKTITFKRKISPISDIVSLFKLISYFKKEKFQIVHTHTPKPGLLGQLAAKITRVPIIINTIHGFYFTDDSSFVKRKFFIYIEKIAASCSDIIFSQNNEDIKTAVKEKICFAPKIKFLGNGIDLQKFNPEKFPKDFIDKKKKKLNINPNFYIIGIVGRLVKEKGYLDLFKAFKIVLEKFPKTLLLIIGPEEPEKGDKINQGVVEDYGINKNVLFLGQRTDVDELYSLMDIFILPSHREGLPRSVLEASAMELPTVVTNIRGCREAVDDGKTGILVPVRNPEKLAEAIIYLFKNSEKAKQMGKNGRIKVIKEFDERLVFDRIKREYQRLIKEKRN